MYPTIGFIDSYSLMIFIGVILCFVYLHLFYVKTGKSKQILYTVELQAIVSIIIGIVSAMLFENLYEFIQSPSTYSWTWGMTFYGGLIGGALAFFGLYFLFLRKKYGKYLPDVLTIAPACICIAHGCGRIGCFLAGCCYGVETSSWIGVKFPGMEHKVVPTNLMEAIFLILLSLLLLFLALKKETHYCFPVYMVTYGIWRFIIEFWRGDNRGKFIGNISPSQFWSILLFTGGILLTGYLIYKDIHLKKKA